MIRRLASRRLVPVAACCESFESRVVLSSSTLVPLIAMNLPVAPAGAVAADAAFIDPTAQIRGGSNISIAGHSYVAPFAALKSLNGGKILIGEGSDIQDNVDITSRQLNIDVVLGNHVIIAHNATISTFARSAVHIGSTEPGAEPSFVGFNAIIRGATVEEDAMVLHLARVQPGITIHSGFKVLPGKDVRTQAQADNPALGKVALVTAADRAFMAGVLEVNEDFAEGYAKLYYGSDGPGGTEHLDAVMGVGADPDTTFNPGVDLPDLGAMLNVTNSAFRNRIIGEVALAQTLDQLSAVTGNSVSIRADEGEPFTIGTIARIEGTFTMHALEHTGITVGNNVNYGFHSLVHGGDDSGNSPHETTRIGNDVKIGRWSVVFRSTIGNGISIGRKSLVDGSQLYLKDGNIWADTNGDTTPDVKLLNGPRVPDRVVIINNAVVGKVEW